MDMRYLGIKPIMILDLLQTRSFEGWGGLLLIEAGGLLCKARVDLFSSRKSFHGVI